MSLSLHLPRFMRVKIRDALQANFEHASKKLEQHACDAEQESAFMAQYAGRIKRIDAQLQHPDCPIRGMLEDNRYEAQRELEKHTCNFEMQWAYVQGFQRRCDRLRRELAEMPQEGQPKSLGAKVQQSDVLGLSGQGA